MKFTLLILFLLFFHTASAQVQQWLQKQPGGDYNVSKGLELDANGNSYVMYYKHIQVNNYGVHRINQYDTQGALIHSTLIDSGGFLGNSGFATQFKLAADSDFYVIFGGNPVTANKVNKQGDFLWSTTANTGFCYFLDTRLDQNENIYVLLDNYSLSTSRVIKFSSSGQVMWSKKYIPGFPAEIQPMAMALDDTGNVYVSGVIIHLDGTGETNTIVYKYNPNGDVEWTKEIQIPVTAEYGGAITCCGTDVYVFTNQFQLYRYDASGNEVWVAQYIPSNPAGDTRKIMCDYNGQIVAIGLAGTDIVTMQYDQSGVLNWSDEYYYFTGVGPWMNEADIDEDGNIVIAGKESYWANDGNFWILKYAASGQLLWDTTYDSNPALYSNDEIEFVHFDYTGDIIVAGTTDYDSEDGAVQGQMATVAKYSEDYATGVNSVWGSQALVVQPNPVSENLFVSGTALNDLFVTDISGKVMSCRQTPASTEVLAMGGGHLSIDVSLLPNGIYFLRSREGAAAAKFIKQ